MIKNNVYYELFASIMVPNSEAVGYWVDLGANSKGKVIKVFNSDLNKWVKLTDVTNEDAVAPYIGPNGNWFVDNRDTGVNATGKNPYVEDNDNWFIYDSVQKEYIDTGITAKGLTAYEIAIKHGFIGTEQQWLDSLSKASEEAAVVALSAANKANEATDAAKLATANAEIATDAAHVASDRANEIANNPPKIVDNNWWMYDELQKKYIDTGIGAIGDAFTYKKEYPSIAAMEADFATPDVAVGEYVLINTGDVQNPDDAKVYLKTKSNWKFIVDLSGMQGIQGWSAYEVAVRNGYEGTEAEWVKSLSQDSKDAAAAALAAKAQVEATEQSVKNAEALRVTAETSRVNAEDVREDNEADRITNENARKAEETKRISAETIRIANEDSRKSEEVIRKTNEATRITEENKRAAAETNRATAEASRVTEEEQRVQSENARKTAETSRNTAETTRISNEDSRIAAETIRDTAEDERLTNEANREANEAVRETQEAARQKNTSDAITAVNAAKTATEIATTNATTAANNANAQAARAKEYADNPPRVNADGYWEVWDDTTDTYVSTGWPASGMDLKGRFETLEELEAVTGQELGDAYVVGLDLYLWNNEQWINLGRFQGPQGEPGKDAEVTKAAVEAVLVGEVTTHTHDTRYYTKDQTDTKVKEVADDLATNYYNKSQVDSKFTSVYIFKGSVDTYPELPSSGNIVGDVWNVRENDKNYAWTNEGWDELGGTADLASLTSNGLMSKEDFAKLTGIETGAQVNKIESITKRVPLNVVNKNVVIPEDIKIADAEPTEEEIMWLDPSEDYNFTFDGYTKAQSDERFVLSEADKGLSTNDYTTLDKTKVGNLTDYVTGGTNALAGTDSMTITLNTKSPITGNAGTSNITVAKATVTSSGVMSASDKVKLDNLENYDDSTVTANIASLQSNKIDTVEVTGSGNVITTATKNGTKIAFAKGITAMTQDTSDARYVKKTGDTMSGRLNIKTPASTGFTLRLAKETSDTPENDEIFVRMDIDDNNKGSFGYHNTHGTSMYNYGSSSRFHIANDGELKYLTNGVDGKVWHAGNDGPGSGLDADLVDSHHVGFQNNDVALYANFPSWGTLITNGLLREDYAEVGHPTEDYLKALCKWAIKNYTNQNVITIQGRIAPNSQGWCIISLYSSNGFDETTLLPRYCIGQFIHMDSGIFLFNTRQAVWSCEKVVTYSNLEDSLAYWYENNENISTTMCTTGGNRNVIESLRSKFKRCIAKPYGDDAALISYCSETDSTKWPDGSSVEILFTKKENRMVHFPKYYHKTVEISPRIWRTYISEVQIDNDYIEEPEMLLGVCEGVATNDGLFSGFDQTSSASLTISTFVERAKINGPNWGITNYRAHATIARMFCAYYKTTNISTSNANIPCSGGTKRYDNGLTGGTKTLGNKDGKLPVNGDTAYYSTNFLGLEDCYYSKWEFVQGINVLKGKYVVYDGGSFPDKDVAELEAAGATNIRIAGYEPNPAATSAYSGWTTKLNQGRYGDVTPAAHGGSESTYYSDYSWFNPTGNRIFIRSGNSAHGSRCGVFLANATNASSHSWTDIGARLAFYGKIVVVDSDDFKKNQI